MRSSERIAFPGTRLLALLGLLLDGLFGERRVATGVGVAVKDILHWGREKYEYEDECPTCGDVGRETTTIQSRYPAYMCMSCYIKWDVRHGVRVRRLEE